MSESVAISDYEIFDNAMEDVNKLSTAIENAEKSIQNCQTQLSNESIFMGPIADSCRDELKKVMEEQISTMKGSYSSTKNTLSATKDNYKNSDNNAEKIFGSSDSTTLGNTQASSFYELGDRAYEGDSAAQQ